MSEFEQNDREQAEKIANLLRQRNAAFGHVPTRAELIRTEWGRDWLRRYREIIGTQTTSYTPARTFAIREGNLRSGQFTIEIDNLRFVVDSRKEGEVAALLHYYGLIVNPQEGLNIHTLISHNKSIDFFIPVEQYIDANGVKIRNGFFLEYHPFSYVSVYDLRNRGLTTEEALAIKTKARIDYIQDRKDTIEALNASNDTKVKYLEYEFFLAERIEDVGLFLLNIQSHPHFETNNRLRDMTLEGFNETACQISVQFEAQNITFRSGGEPYRLLF